MNEVIKQEYLFIFNDSNEIFNYDLERLIVFFQLPFIRQI